MFDVKKLVDGIVAFVNFFVVRIAVVSFFALLIYKITGEYYFQMIRSYFSSSPLGAQDLKSYIATASDYVTESNVKNAIFVITLVICLSLLDILYRIVGLLGSVLPVTMFYDYRFIGDRARPLMLETWRRYAKQYKPLEFCLLVEERATNELWKSTTYDRWWTILFRYTKSCIVLLLILFLFTPRGAIKTTPFHS